MPHRPRKWPIFGVHLTLFSAVAKRVVRDYHFRPVMPIHLSDQSDLKELSAEPFATMDNKPRSTDMTASAAPKAEEDEYFRRIDECAANRTSVTIPNSLPTHARYLMTKMFSLSKSQVRLFSGKLERTVDRGGNSGCPPAAVYGDANLLEAVQRFLARENVVLRVLVQQDVDGGLASHPLVSLISGMKENGTLKGTVEFRQLQGEQTKIENHFMVADDSAYRLEFDHDPCQAQANFNNVSIARGLIDAFDNYLFPDARQIYVS